MAGLDSTGLSIKRFSEILSDLETLQLEKVSSDLSFADDSVIGQINSVLAEMFALFWELTESVNSNFNKNSAEAKNLDDLGALIGITRQLEKKTSGIVEVIGTEGTSLLAGHTFQSSVTSKKFVVPTQTDINALLCKQVTYTVAQVLNATDYDLTINGILYTYTSDASATANEISTGIKALIDVDTNITWSASLSGDDLVIATTDTFEISVFSETYLSVTTVTKLVTVDAEEFGAIVVPANTVTINLGITTGITSLNNPTALIIGRLNETDEEYRLRFAVSNSLRGKATLPAIRSAVSSVSGVSNTVVLENTTATVDGDGLDPHSFEVVVQGGDDTEVATSIWNTKPSSIASFGTTSENLTDSTGIQRAVKFTRPVIINMAVQVTYAVYSEETFPDNGKELISDIVLAQINSLVVGVDVIPQRLFGPIYSGVVGIQDLTVEIQTLTTPGDTPGGGSWVETPIAISQKELAQTTLTDITIVAP